MGGGCPQLWLGRAAGRKLLGAGSWALAEASSIDPGELGPQGPPRASIHCACPGVRWAVGLFVP